MLKLKFRLRQINIKRGVGSDWLQAFVFSWMTWVQLRGEELIQRLVVVSQEMSKRLRPVFEHKRLRMALGAHLVGAVLITGSLTPPIGALDLGGEPELTVVASEEVVVVTKERFQVPVETLGVSQGFHRFHRAIDLRAPLGTAVYPVADGMVTEVISGRFGYGHWVVVDHQDGYASMYAHLGRIEVEKGQEVTQETKLGEIGLTGWTTGPHLHLEMYEQGIAINPRLVLPL
jgi:murein DD-endopeptidase MepM/ murein hydrolase activator NlpD